jgi:PIN domain nuclease of toxin-antitoxin system
MNLLLDTHTFLWWDTQPGRLSAKALSAIQDRANRLLLSVASVWEMQIKLQIGRLNLNMPLDQMIARQRRSNRVQILPVTLAHVLALRDLPLHHRDPFDRLLIAQANAEGAFLVSHDPVFTQYPVQLLW